MKPILVVLLSWSQISYRSIRMSKYKLSEKSQTIWTTLWYGRKLWNHLTLKTLKFLLKSYQRCVFRIAPIFLQNKPNCLTKNHFYLQFFWLLANKSLTQIIKSVFLNVLIKKVRPNVIEKQNYCQYCQSGTNYPDKINLNNENGIE